MFIKHLPVIFLLPFSKALDYTKKWQWLRFLFIFAFVFFTLAWIFLLVIFVSSEDEIVLPLPASLVSMFLIIFIFLSDYSYDALIMLRKDLDASRLALNNWNKVKEKGKLRFIFSSYLASDIIVVVIWLYLMDAKRILGPEFKASTLIITGVFVLGILLTIRFFIWRLNIRDEDKIAAQIWQ